jgi:hypothetical protein
MSKTEKVWKEKSPLTGYMIEETGNDENGDAFVKEHRFEKMDDALRFFGSHVTEGAPEKKKK